MYGAMELWRRAAGMQMWKRGSIEVGALESSCGCADVKAWMEGSIAGVELQTSRWNYAGLEPWSSEGTLHSGVEVWRMERRRCATDV